MRLRLPPLAALCLAFVFVMGSVIVAAPKAAAHSTTLQLATLPPLAVRSDGSPATYDVSFVESGLNPFQTNGSWTVTFNGTTIGKPPGLFGGNSLDFGSFPNGTYIYGIAPVQGYSQSSVPANGTVTVAGAPVTVQLTFVPNPYSITFHESGLPAAQLAKHGWTILLGGATDARMWSELPTISFAGLSNGTYAYLITGPAGFVVANGSPVATVSISGSLLNESVLFVPGHTHTLTFAEHGLPRTGPVVQEWCVVLIGPMRCSTGTTNKYTNLTPANYSYLVNSPRNGFQITAKLGSLVEPTAGVLGIFKNTLLSLKFEYPYLVVFTATGLPVGTNWSVTLAGVKHYSTTDNITFFELNGTYHYRAGSKTGGNPTVPVGAIHVVGDRVDVRVAFPPSYTITFVSPVAPGPGLGLNWWSATIGNQSAWTNSSTELNLTEPNGTYTYRLTSSNHGTLIVTLFGTVVVQGANVTVYLP